MQCDLNGKVSLVTGAARGIGQAIANRLAANGSQVVFTDIDGDGAMLASAQVVGGVSLRMDVTKSEDVQAAIRQTVEQFGRLDILVNNAGVNTLAGRVTIDQFPREEWDRVLAVDITGLYEVSRTASAIMRT